MKTILIVKNDKEKIHEYFGSKSEKRLVLEFSNALLNVLFLALTGLFDILLDLRIKII